MSSPTTRDRNSIREWLPLGAFVFVIVALIALASTPAILMERIALVMDDIATTILPTYNALRDVEFAMEERISSSRSRLAVDDPRYAVRLAEARAAETAALQVVQDLAPRFGVEFNRHLELLGRVIASRDSLEAVLHGMPVSMESYRNALPRFDQLRDSMLVHLAGLEQELENAADERIREEARWANLQRALSAVLGVVAVIAAMVVGWFAWLQRRLRRKIQHALAESNHLRTETERRRQQLERITESRARLMRGFSHDVKNPLGAASGYLGLLADGVVGRLTEPQLRSVRQASISIDAALTLVNDLLELARTESGHIDLALAPTDVGTLVREAAEAYRAQAEAKRLTLAIDQPDTLPPIVTDGARVRQILGNLLSNAVKYTRAGALTVRSEVASDSAATGTGRIGIAVSDTGPGIAAAQQELLFQEFVRLDPSSAEGAGVGLTISQRIAHALGGEITVDSEVGRGSTFTLWLPLTSTPENRLPHRVSSS